MACSADNISVAGVRRHGDSGDDGMAGVVAGWQAEQKAFFCSAIPFLLPSCGVIILCQRVGLPSIFLLVRSGWEMETWRWVGGDMPCLGLQFWAKHYSDIL